MLDTAPHQALLGAQGEWWRDRSLERGKVVGVNLGREPERRIDDRRINVEEVLRNGARAGVFVAQTRDEDRRFTVVVELEVDAALGEDRTLELAQCGVLLDGESVLEDEAGIDV